MHTIEEMKSSAISLDVPGAEGTVNQQGLQRLTCSHINSKECGTLEGK